MKKGRKEERKKGRREDEKKGRREEWKKGPNGRIQVSWNSGHYSWAGEHSKPFPIQTFTHHSNWWRVFVVCFLLTGIQHAGCTKQCRCNSMAGSPCSGSKLFKFVNLFCSKLRHFWQPFQVLIKSKVFHPTASCAQWWPTTQTCVMMRGNEKKWHQKASAGVKLPVFRPLESMGWESGNGIFYFHLFTIKIKHPCR